MKSVSNTLPVRFQARDALTRVSRESLKKIAKELGFNESQTVHFALAKLRDELLARSTTDETDDITPAQLAAIRRAAPKAKGKIISSLI